MLQGDPVRNLQFDNEIRVAQQPDLEEPRVFEGRLTITAQPRPVATVEPRKPIPISTIEQNIPSRSRTFVPRTGYDFLADLPSLHVEQTFELNESLTSVSSENRFIIRSPLGDAVYAASEYSTENDRLIWGAGRPFQMRLIDKTHQEAIVFRKKFACGAFMCHPKNLEVWTQPGNILGRITQSPTLLSPMFFIEDEDGQPVFCIEGPTNTGFCCFCLPKESYFKIHSGNDLRASIDRKWLASKSQYTTNIYFSDIKLTAKERALILGAAFLLEYLYFQTRF